MLIVGELLNASRAEVDELLARRDEAKLLDLARRQLEGGAHFLDLNVGVRPKDEKIALFVWAIKTLQSKLSVSISIDDTDPRVLETALAVHDGQSIANSLGPDDLETAAGAIKKYAPKVVFRAWKNDTIQSDAIKKLKDMMDPKHLYLDVEMLPVAIVPEAATRVVQKIDEAMQFSCKTIAGLSNVSYCMPSRRLLNRVMAPYLMAHGINALILDPTDTALTASLIAARCLHFGETLEFVHYCRRGAR